MRIAEENWKVRASLFPAGWQQTFALSAAHALTIAALILQPQVHI